MSIVPLMCPTSLDFTKLRSPPNHGDVLVVPEASSWFVAARANAEMLRGAKTSLLGATLAYWRKNTREAVVGTDDRLVIVWRSILSLTATLPKRRPSRFPVARNDV
jgi:hypothetical protein